MAGTVHTGAYKEFVRSLVALRHERGLSQADLAKLLGKPPSFVGKYELGERRLDLIETLVILRAFNVEPLGYIDGLNLELPDALR